MVKCRFFFFMEAKSTVDMMGLNMFLLFQYCLCVTFSSIQSLAFNKLTNLVELDLGNNKLKVSSYIFSINLFILTCSYYISYLAIFLSISMFCSYVSVYLFYYCLNIQILTKLTNLIVYDRSLDKQVKAAF